MSHLHAAFVAGGIGDQLMHFSQMQAYTRLFGGQIDIFCQHAGIMRKIGQNCHWLNEVHEISPFKKMGHIGRFSAAVKSLSGKNYQNAIIFHPSTSFKTAAFLAGIPGRIGIQESPLDRLLLSGERQNTGSAQTRRQWGHRPFGEIFNQHLIDRHMDPVGTAPIAPKPVRSAAFDTFIAPLPGPHIVVNLFSADPARRWPTAHAADCLAKLVEKHGGTLFLSSGNDARDWNESFLQCWPTHLPKPVDLLCAGIDLSFELELYHAADAYVGVNSFTANLAMNCDLPSVVLYNKPSDFLNYRQNSLGVFPTVGDAMDSITQTDISEAFTALLRQRQHQPAPRKIDQPLPV